MSGERNRRALSSVCVAIVSTSWRDESGRREAGGGGGGGLLAAAVLIVGLLVVRQQLAILQGHLSVSLG